MQQGQRNHRKRDQGQQHEGRAGADEPVKGIGRKHCAEQRHRTGCRQRTRYHCIGIKFGNPRQRFPPHDLATGHQQQAEQCRQRQPCRWSEQTGLDRIAHEKDAAERKSHAADPDRPAGTKIAFEIFP
ncbi:hypothetical protein D3C80_395160 [compost metagenome]